MAPLPIAPAAAAAPAAPLSVPRASFGAALRAQTAAAGGGVAPPPGLARAALASVERARERLDAVLAAARRGRTFSAQELLALQADAYRYSQTVEVAARVVEHGAQAVKQAVNTQV
jgi:septum formation topological specificity factor MinE